jgi:putative toxin-antitoxin system antitoxin component (TIGR02293 family)
MKAKDVNYSARGRSSRSIESGALAVGRASHGVSTEEHAQRVAREERIYRRSCQLLGGGVFARRRLASRSDVHSALVGGLPYGSLLHLVAQMEKLKEVDVVKVLGISARTLRRQGEAPGKSMPVDLASRTWLLAETLAKAAEIFGSKEDAELWMSQPAMGLDGGRPIDLLQTVQGAELVNDFLGRLEYGVYA